MNIVFRAFIAVFVCDVAPFHSRTTTLVLAQRVVNVTDEDVLHIFNEHRQNLIPPAADMMLIRWNEELRDHADSVASQCKAGGLAELPEDEYLGFRIELPPTEDIKHYIHEYLNNQLANCKNGSCDELYLKTVWHSLQEIGCATWKCEAEVQGYLVVCFYDTQVAVADLDSAYTIGTPCTRCPGDFPVCHDYYSLCTDQIPTDIIIITQPGPNLTKAGQRLTSNAKIEVLDQNGEIFNGKMNSACPYEIGVEFAARSHHEARLRGDTTAHLVNGVAKFSDLAVTQHGEYKLRFYLESPVNGSALEVTSDMLVISYPSDTIDNCTVEEGEEQFERFYDWKTSNCSKVCIEDCKGQYSRCYELEGCGPHANCEDGKCVCKDFRDVPRFQFNAESLMEMLRPYSICDPNRVAVRLDKCGLNMLGYTLADLYILGPKDETNAIDPFGDINDQLHSYIQSCAYNDCRGQVMVGADGVGYEFGVSGNFGDCNGEISDNGTHVTYTHKVRGFGGYSSSKVVRKRSLAVDFSCTYVRRFTTSLDFGFSVFLGTKAVTLRSKGEFEVEISIWKDSTYTTRYTLPPEILVPEVVYAGITLKGLESTQYVLYADHCYATPTPDGDHAINEDLITDGCANSDDIAVAQNGEAKEVFFSFKSFHFTDQPDNKTTYIHCDVVVCATNDAAACTVSCSKRRRKRSTTEQHESATVSIGPLVMMDGTHEYRSTNIQDKKYSSYFSSAFSTQELINPPAERTAGLASVNVYFT